MAIETLIMNQIPLSHCTLLLFARRALSREQRNINNHIDGISRKEMRNENTAVAKKLQNKRGRRLESHVERSHDASCAERPFDLQHDMVLPRMPHRPITYHRL